MLQGKVTKKPHGNRDHKGINSGNSADSNQEKEFKVGQDWSEVYYLVLKPHLVGLNLCFKLFTVQFNKIPTFTFNYRNKSSGGC